MKRCDKHLFEILAVRCDVAANNSGVSSEVPVGYPLHILQQMVNAEEGAPLRTPIPEPSIYHFTDEHPAANEAE